MGCQRDGEERDHGWCACCAFIRQQHRYNLLRPSILREFCQQQHRLVTRLREFPSRMQGLPGRKWSGSLLLSDGLSTHDESAASSGHFCKVLLSIMIRCRDRHSGKPSAAPQFIIRKKNLRSICPCEYMRETPRSHFTLMVLVRFERHDEQFLVKQITEYVDVRSERSSEQ